MAKRMITTEFTQEDEKIETGLRPQYLIDYIGQKKVKDNLKVYIEAAKSKTRIARSCSFIWSSGTWKDNPCRDHSK